MTRKTILGRAMTPSEKSRRHKLSPELRRELDAIRERALAVMSPYKRRRMERAMADEAFDALCQRYNIPEL